MSKITWKGGALLAPVPAVMVTCREGERNNVLTVAWTGILCSSPAKTYISLRPSRYSHELVAGSGMFVINLVPRRLAKTADWCGMKSGRDVDKLAECHLSVSPSPNLSCPMLDDSPVSIECRVSDRIALGSHEMFIGDILSVSVDDAFIDQGGKLRLDKADIVGFAHGSYYSLGSFLGNIGFSVGTRKTARRTAKRKKT